MAKKWGVKLSGHEFDLADWQEVLKEPFEPYVEMIERDGQKLNILFSSQFADLKAADEVRQRAVGLVQKLNGIMQMERNCKPLTFDGVVELQDGKVAIHHYAMIVEGMNLRARAGAMGIQIVRDGIVQPPPPPTESHAQRLSRDANGSDLIADIFEFLAKAVNWYELYKIIELCEEKEGSEHALVARFGELGKEWKAAKTTANFYRHARAYRPDRLVPFDEAKSTILAVIRQILA